MGAGPRKYPDRAPVFPGIGLATEEGGAGA